MAGSLNRMQAPLLAHILQCFVVKISEGLFPVVSNKKAAYKATFFPTEEHRRQGQSSHATSAQYCIW